MLEEVLLPGYEGKLWVSFILPGNIPRSTDCVNGVDFLPPLILLPLHPVLVEIVEHLVDVHRTGSVSVPLLGVKFE